MPRTYKRKLGFRANRTYNSVFVERAVAAVKNKRMSIRTAAESYGVPYTTLHRAVHDKQKKKYGGQAALDIEEENKLTELLLLCAEWGFPFKSYDVRLIVQQYLNKCGKREKRFKDNLPGMDWFKSYLLRHPDLTVKLAENTKRVRAAVSYENIEEYFTNLQNTLIDVPPSNIINYDETNFSDDPGSAKVVVKRGVKHAHRILDTSKSSTSVMFAIAGNGTLLPPYVVYKAKHLYPGWTEGGYPASRYNRTPNGWFDSETFEDWFINIALPYFRNLNDPKLLIGDNLSSHLTMSVIQQCQENNIRFTLLPPNSTHMLQPLDVAYFRSFKAAWRSVLENWKLRNRGVLPKTMFPRLLKETIDKIGAKSEANTLSGFRACGISLFDPDVVLRKIKHLKKNTDQEQERDELNRAWCRSVVDHLTQLRTGDQGTPKRGKKINVAAGKSVRAIDLIPSLIDDDMESERDNDQDTNLDSNVNSDTEPTDLDTMPELLEDEQLNQPSCSKTVENDVDHVTDNSELEVGDFIIVKFATNKRDRFFTAKIVGKTNYEYTVNVLRKKPSKDQMCFVYPTVPDISVIKKEQIVKKISGSVLRRGKYIFENISNYFLE